MRETNLKNRESLYKNYASSVFPDFQSFCDILDKINNDYTALYINNTGTSHEFEDCVFWYKAKKVPDNFKFGSKDFWDFNKARFNKEYVEPL